VNIVEGLFPRFNRKLVVFMNDGIPVVVLNLGNGRYRGVGRYPFWAANSFELGSMLRLLVRDHGGIQKLYVDPPVTEQDQVNRITSPL